jgi:hypothetical protein
VSSYVEHLQSVWHGVLDVVFGRAVVKLVDVGTECPRDTARKRKGDDIAPRACQYLLNDRHYRRLPDSIGAFKREDSALFQHSDL